MSSHWLCHPCLAELIHAVLLEHLCNPNYSRKSCPRSFLHLKSQVASQGLDFFIILLRTLADLCVIPLKANSETLRFLWMMMFVSQPI